VAGVIEPLFEKMGFSLVAKHRSKDVVLYRQGDINFIVNREPQKLGGLLCCRAWSLRVRAGVSGERLAQSLRPCARHGRATRRGTNWADGVKTACHQRHRRCTPVFDRSLRRRQKYLRHRL
jgi:hypothetical protein